MKKGDEGNSQGLSFFASGGRNVGQQLGEYYSGILRSSQLCPTLPKRIVIKPTGERHGS